jgi:RNA polymerase sigma factor (sigma-70 family)
MASSHRDTIFHHLRRLVGACAAAEAADEQLLGRFLAGRDEAAFEALVQRYGPIVLGVCRRVLHDPADVEDAFQATFLILVRKAPGLREPRLLGPWLHGVAYRVAVRTRASAARRRHHEMQAPARPATDPDTRADWRELRPLLDAEVSRLPERYRLPFVLCQLEGKTTEEAARCLGCPRGTVLSRLARARERLRSGLARRGLALSAALLAAELAREVEAAVPAPLTAATAQSALRFLALPAAGTAPTPAAALAQGVMKTMFLTKLRNLTVLLLALTALGAASGVLAHHALAPKQPVEPPADLAAKAGKGPDAPGGRAQPDSFGEPLPAGALARLGRLRLRHGGPVAAVAFSPNGRILASAGGDDRGQDHKHEQAICLWEADTGKEVAHLQAPGWNVWALAFSPDGKTLAATSTRGVGVHAVGTLTLWDVATRKPLHQLPSARRSMTTLPLAFSPDGKQVAANGDDGMLRIWDVTTGREDARVQIRFRASALAYSPKGDTLAAGGWDGTVHRFDTATGKELSAWSGHPRWLRSLAFSTDGKVLASLGVFGSVHVWRTDTGKEISLPGGVLGTVASLACSATGSLLAVLETPAATTGTRSQVVRLWDLKDGARLAGEFSVSDRKADSPEEPVEAPTASCLTFSPDGKALAVAGRDGAIRLWDENKCHPRTWPAGHQEAVRAFAYTRDGRTLVTGGDDHTIRFWDPASGKELRAFDRGTVVTGLALSPDGRRLATAGQDGTVAVRDAATGQVLARIEPTDEGLSGARRTVAAVAFAADGRTLNVATAHVQETGHILGPTRALLVGAWDVKTAEPVRQRTALWGRGFVSRLRCAFAADGQTLLVFAGSQAFLMDAAGRKDALPEHREGVCSALAMSGDAGLLALGIERQGRQAREKTAAIMLWKKGSSPGAAAAPKDGYRPFQSLSGEITALALSADGKLLASAREEGESRLIQVWVVATGKECGRFEGHRDRVTALGFAPDGKTLASASADATVLVWQVR